MNSKIFFIILLVLAGAIIFGVSTRQRQEISLLTPQTKTMGAVEVAIKPISVLPGEDVVFEVSMNTHSLELHYDYAQITTLTDDRGNSYKPTKWTGGNSGHHLKGELVFDALPQNPRELTITLEGIDNKSETFIWQL